MELVLLGVSGGIAAYKAPELARLFVRAGYKVQAVATPAATRFVAPLALQTVTRRPVLSDIFAPLGDSGVEHIDLAEEASLAVVAPATANTIGKLAAGIADNFLTTLLMAVKCPVLLAPSMNERMYASSALKHNLELLHSRGYRIMAPAFGELACGAAGQGRMPEPREIFLLARSLMRPKDLGGIQALVTAGPTREYLDPVRYLSNPSTGLMGYAVAQALAERGAAVTLVSGPAALPAPAGVELVQVTTAEEMYHAVMERYRGCHLVVKAAAVSDYRPEKMGQQKFKKGSGRLNLTLVANPDILKELGFHKERQILVGFAAETEAAVENAREKLKSKRLDLIVANDVTLPGAGFGSPTNQVRLIDASGKVEELPVMEKEKLAHIILDRVIPLLAAAGKS